MRKVAEKTQILDFIGKKFGRTLDKQTENAERVMKSVTGGSNTLMKSRMADLDRLYGTNFAARAEATGVASTFGGATPQVFSAPNTGRSLLGMAAGSAVGGVVSELSGKDWKAGAATGALLSSPRGGALLLGASDKITGFIGKMAERPEVLAQIAGIKGAGTPMKNAAGKVIRMNIPGDVREVARQMYSAFKNDGPISMGSVARLVADTPYFFPIVHFFEVASRSRSDAESRANLQRAFPPQGQGTPNVAMPQSAPPGAQPTR
jgi:hypothetical protein